MSPDSSKKSVAGDVSDPRAFTLLNELLTSGFDVRIRVTGSSMSPFLLGGEVLTIRKVMPGSLRLGDLIFFRTPEDIPVLHRIIGKKTGKDKSYTFRTKGDAVSIIDDPVTERDILGKVCRIEQIHAVSMRRLIDMELPIWKAMNFSLALVSIGKGKVTAHPALAAFLRRIKKAFV
ncbi:MAG: signal peptidase I [Nitrospirota bacterium]